jgi:hypothetical protein
MKNMIGEARSRQQIDIIQGSLFDQLDVKSGDEMRTTVISKNCREICCGYVSLLLFGTELATTPNKIFLIVG